MASKLQIPRVSDAVAASLERRILDASLKPGDRLPAERDLAAELGVSRPSLREAIQKLAAKGLLHSRQGGGTYVTGSLGSAFSDPWRGLLGNHPRLHEEMLEFRRMIEGQAAAWAAERATADDLLRLEKSLADLREAGEAGEANDTERRAQADIAFHQAIGEAAHNALLGHLSTALLRLMQDSMCLNLDHLKNIPSANNLLIQQHIAIGKAIAERKPGAARHAAETHIDFVRETLAQSLHAAARRKEAESSPLSL